MAPRARSRQAVHAVRSRQWSSRRPLHGAALGLRDYTRCVSTVGDERAVAVTGASEGPESPYAVCVRFAHVSLSAPARFYYHLDFPVFLFIFSFIK